MKLFKTRFAIPVLSILLLASCKGKTERVEIVEDFNRVEFSSDDSLEVRSLAEHYVQLYNEGNYDAAANMLNVVHNDSIHPLEAEERESYKRAMTALPHIEAKLADIKFYNELDNLIRIAVKMTEAGDFDTGRGTINFFLNPVKRDGTWYLTLADKYAEGVGHDHDADE